MLRLLYRSIIITTVFSFLRRKAFNNALELESVKEVLNAIALSHPSITITLRNECTGEKLLQTFSTRNYQEAFLNIFLDIGLSLKNLFQVSADNENWSIEGFIGGQGFSNTSLQFIFVNSR